MQGRHGCKLRAQVAIMVGLVMAGPGCQSTSLFSGRSGLLPDSQTGGSVFPIVLGRPQAAGQPLAITSHSPIRARTGSGDTGAACTVIATSGWRPVQRPQTPSNGIVAVSDWQTNGSLNNPGITSLSVQKPADQPATGTAGKESTNGEPPIMLPPPRPLPVAEGHPEAGPLPPPDLAPPHASPGHAPAELSKVLMPAYIIEPPDILLIESKVKITALEQPIQGQHLVRPDGTVSLGVFGSIRVAGMTTEQVRAAVARAIDTRRERGAKPTPPEDVNVDVLAYNSKVYYIITDGAGYGEQVFRAPFTGNETVLDAISLINGLPPVASKKKIWVARRVPGHGGHYNNILPVDWCAITQGGATGTNYQIFPGDRIYVKSQSLIRFDNNLNKFLSPIERLFGTTLLGSETVNSIRNRTGLGGIP